MDNFLKIIQVRIIFTQFLRQEKRAVFRAPFNGKHCMTNNDMTMLITYWGTKVVEIGTCDEIVVLNIKILKLIN